MADNADNEDRDIPGFTQSQKGWFHDRDGSRCSMVVYKNGAWHRCPETRYLHVHHVTPRGWYDEHSRRAWDVNDETNGIVICNSHHVGKYADFSDRYVIHPDMRDFYARYGDDVSEVTFENYVRPRRHDLARQGVPYWNTMWDWLFYRLVKYRNREWDGREYPARDDPWYVNELSQSQLFKE